MSNIVLSNVSKCVTASKLALYLDEMSVIKFIQIILHNIHQVLFVTNIYIGEPVNAKFVGLQIDHHLNWKNHADK